jgi:hypothetical protein
MDSAPPPRPTRSTGIATLLAIAVATLIVTAIGVFVVVAIDRCWLGLGSCPIKPPEVRTDIASSVLNSPGSDNPSDEYVCLVNAGVTPVDLTGWQLRSAGGDAVNTLPSFSLGPGAEVRVHPGEGRRSAHNLFGTTEAASWLNDGGAVTLVDANGKQIASTTYGPQDEKRPAGSCR